MNKDVFHLQVYYSGKVQGVGFRYQTLQVAREFVVNGEVKNLDDGRVLAIAEGEEAEVLAFQNELEERMKNFIRDKEQSTAIQAASHKGFNITH